MNHIAATETGVVRVFALTRPADMPRGQIVQVSQIAEWLRVASLNDADVQQIWTDDMIDDLDLQGLLAAGYDIDADQIAVQTDILDGAMEAHPTMFVIIRSSAFVDRPVDLHNDGPLYVIASFNEPGANISFQPLPNPDPAPALEDAPQKKKPSDAAMGGRVATIALIVMGLLVWLMIKIAG